MWMGPTSTDDAAFRNEYVSIHTQIYCECNSVSFTKVEAAAEKKSEKQTDSPRITKLSIVITTKSRACSAFEHYIL